MNMFIVWRVLAAALGGALGAALILAGLWKVGGAGRVDLFMTFALCTPSSLLGVLFAGPAGPSGWVRGALAGATPGVLFGPIGVLPLGIAGGIAAAIFPREDSP